MYDIIQREEPERWRRHIVRRHVVSEIPQPEIEVEEVDTEAPRDAWGFPAMVGTISLQGCACAPCSGISLPREQTAGLISQMLRVDVVEAYSPPRVTLEAKDVGLKAGEAWDLTNGWDFTKKDHQEQAESYLDKQKPLVRIGSPPCTPFSQLQSLNPVTERSKHKWK